MDLFAAARAVLHTAHAAAAVALGALAYWATAPHLPTIPAPGGPVPTAGFAAIAVVLAAAFAPGVIIRKIRNHP